jgi:hypothetical protein
MQGLKSDCRRGCARSSPPVASFNARRMGALNMSVCYLHNDNEIDAERCRISLREKSPVTLFTRDSAGRVLCLTGVVQSIQFDPDRAIGSRWRVEMDAGRMRKARQRAP